MGLLPGVIVPVFIEITGFDTWKFVCIVLAVKFILCFTAFPMLARLQDALSILDLQPISRESPDNVTRPLRLVPTIELIKYSFVIYHQHGRRANQEYSVHKIKVELWSALAPSIFHPKKSFLYSLK